MTQPIPFDFFFFKNPHNIAVNRVVTLCYICFFLGGDEPYPWLILAEVSRESEFEKQKAVAGVNHRGCGVVLALTEDDEQGGIFCWDGRSEARHCLRKVEEGKFPEGMTQIDITLMKGRTISQVFP